MVCRRREEGSRLQFKRRKLEAFPIFILLLLAMAALPTAAGSWHVCLWGEGGGGGRSLESEASVGAVEEGSKRSLLATAF